MPMTLGTAGHVDHGKTALIEALTGTNTDRLEEERQRGISIELGFALLQLEGGRNVSVVDVPGHHRLVRAMVAGSGAIDLFLLVIAVDDGVMPQTREHLAVLHALGISDGVVALTKVDRAAPAMLHQAHEEASRLAPDLPIVEVSVRDGTGLAALKRELAAVTKRIESNRAAIGGRPATEEARPLMHLDRVFSVRGIGTVVTGTLRGGPLREGQHLRVLPDDRATRVRSLQIHDCPTDRADPGQRVAVNLSGLSRTAVSRGDALVGRESLIHPTFRLDVTVDGNALALPHRVQAHHGTRHAVARVVAGEGGALAQLRLESPLIARPGERVVLRRISPPGTICGAVVIDSLPPRHSMTGEARRLLEAVLDGDQEEAIGAARARLGGRIPSDRSSWSETPLLELVISRFGETQTIEVLRSVERNESSRQLASTASEMAPAAAALGGLETRVLEILRNEGTRPRPYEVLSKLLGVPRREFDTALEGLARRGLVIRLKGEITYPADRLQRLGETACGLARPSGSISLAELRDALGLSRKYAQAILEWLDAGGYMVRRGDRHYLRRPNEAASVSGSSPQ